MVREGRSNSVVADNLGTSHVRIPRELYNKACIKSEEQALAVSRKIGLPVMVKASEGGGGKGIRKVETEENIPTAYRQVSVSYMLSQGRVDDF